MNEDTFPTPGTIVLNKYRILEEIGRGGMGVIYLSEDIRLGRQVALKELVLSRTIQGKERDDIISRFQREARTTSTLNHPNIVTIFDVGEDHRQHFIAMEYLPGKTLQDYLVENYNFMLEEILDIFIQIASALDHAHSKGVIHRDIKPDNVKVLQDNVVKIMDFGIAGLENRNSNLTQDGTILGTIAYISPEQLYNTKNVTTRADLFSYGVMMYEMFTHKLPFDGDTVGATIMKIMAEQPEPPRNLNSRIPELIEKVILRCLEKDPNNRFDNARQVVEELVAFRISLSNRELRDQILDEGLATRRNTHPTYMSSFRMTNLHTGSTRIGKFKLLHVEDDHLRQQLLVDYIKHAGLPYECAQASTVAAARQMISQETYDFIICDYMLKDGDAEPVIDMIHDGTPLIMVTSMNQPEMIIKLMKKGAVDYILKTTAIEEIRQIVSIIQEKTKGKMLLSVDELRPPGSKAAEPVGDSAMAAAIKPASPDDSGVQFEKILGRQGDKPGEFTSPRWVRYCPYTDTLLVADTQNSRVQILGPEGDVLRILQHEEMKAPCAVTSAPDGRIYVLDAGDAKVRVFSAEGLLEKEMGGKPAFKSAFGLALLPNQQLLVTDPEGHCVHLLSQNGDVKDIFSKDFKSPSGITLAGEQVYILDHGLSAVLKLDTHGQLLSRFGKRGTAKGDFSIPKGIAVNEQGLIFVAEALSHRVQIFDPQGNWITTFGKKGSGEGEFSNPESLACRPEGNVYVLDRGNHRLQMFKYPA